MASRGVEQFMAILDQMMNMGTSLQSQLLQVSHDSDQKEELLKLYESAQLLREEYSGVRAKWKTGEPVDIGTLERIKHDFQALLMGTAKLLNSKNNK